MKKLLILLIISLMASPFWAQGLVDAEYYYDSDPGVGNGTAIAITSGDSVTKTQGIDVTGLDPGFHYVFIRVRDDLGRWSIVKRHLFYIYDDTEIDLRKPQADLTGFEYFFDTDLGQGTGTWVSSTPMDSLTEDINYSVSGLTTGFHRLMVRARDASGKWGHLRSSLFYVFDDTSIDLRKVRSKLVAAEYFFDKDSVPQGQGTSLTITPGNEIEWSGGISVEGMEAGDHVLFIRAQDSAGVWSIVYAKEFTIVSLNVSTNSPICQGSDQGEAEVSITGGKPPFTYLWDDPQQQSGPVATGLKAGFYTVTVTDAVGALLKETVEIVEFDTIDIAITTSDTDCKLSQGSATAVASGVNGPFKYLWTTGSAEASTINLSSGIYEVTVTDNAGCQNKAVAAINDIGGPQISTDGRILHLKCADDANGGIDPLISGGSAPYTYSWSNGETTKGILNLRAGTYELTVTDAQECIATSSIKVEAPPPLTFSLSVNNADCGSQNGSATISVHGGSTPYFYTWTGLSPPHNATRTGLGAGVYEVSVLDNNNCAALAQVAVSEKGAPSVNVTSVTQSTCGNTNGSVLIAVSGGTGLYSYNWKDESGSTVSTAKDLTGVGSGIYSASVSDGSGCETFATATIPAEQPPTEQICLVTVDSLGKNLLVWNKTPGKGIIAYRVYRETTSAGVFDSIAYIPVDSLSTYTDIFADPTIRSWRYRLASINSCGVESKLSPPHKTMHLTISLGLFNHINLRWNHYEGFVPKDDQYRIWRHTAAEGWKMIDVVPSNLNSYTDETAPDADLEYYVEAVHPTGCTPLKAATLNSTRSNRKTKLKSTGINEITKIYELTVWPNPSSGIFRLNMNFERTETIKIKVLDISGKLVYIRELKDLYRNEEISIDLSGFEKGLYQLHMDTENGIFNKILVVE